MTATPGSWATNTPVAVDFTSPFIGAYPVNTLLLIPFPLVVRRKKEVKPIRPRVGMLVVHRHVAGAAILHVHELGQAAGQVLGQYTEVLLAGVDGQVLVGLVYLPVDELGHRLGPGDLELVPLTAHGFHKDGQGATHHVRTPGRRRGAECRLHP